MAARPPETAPDATAPAGFAEHQAAAPLAPPSETILFPGCSPAEEYILGVEDAAGRTPSRARNSLAGDGSERELRVIAALEAAGLDAESDHVTQHAIDHQREAMARLAARPALSSRTMGHKAAAAVATMLRGCDGRPDPDVFNLLASLLADAVTLDAGLIDLPKEPGT